MRKVIQFILGLFAIIALVATGIGFYQIVLASTIHGAPVRFIDAQAGPYPLKLALYSDSISAGNMIPFNIAVTSGTSGALNYQVTATPAPGVPASLAQGDVNAQQSTPYGVPGDITLVTRGSWTLNIMISGPAGNGTAEIPLTAVTFPPIPVWLAWNVGLLPLYGLLLFWVAQSRQAARQRSGAERSRPQTPAEVTQEVS